MGFVSDLGLGGGWLVILGVTDGEESGGGEEGAAEGVTAGWADGVWECVCM